MKFSERLTNLRVDADLSQEQISEKLNIKQPSYSQYETQRSEPSLMTLSKLCEIFDVSSDYLLGHTNIKSPVNELLEGETQPEFVTIFNQLSEQDVQKAIDYMQLLIRDKEKK
ncbi:helix-turn-helix transcriptional regulator [Listeria weihenstephanensis]|uniref:Helix-turn-helix transcriptional regulator n=1 Tax=Listeria weihenstephanensis TaxID=1006155 RepID=A0A841Z9Y5_9LIST|nr:helix-turn-helix transcriptional regulator [Listeria weihenstephanensis]MBC1501412.1 helix-turn-helix transcriptional regulator [Listeria weihenstephanensis]